MTRTERGCSLIALVLSGALFACGSNAAGPGAGTGGAIASGGFPASGGVAPSSGGTTGPGGTPMASGGTLGTGGAMGNGGSPVAPLGCGTDGTYHCMTPPMLDPLPKDTTGQWVYHEIAGSKCRDGSPAGLYTLFSGTSTKLLIYLEQGGACFNPALCASNPVRVGDSITGRTLAETIAGMRPGVKQTPPATGIFDLDNDQNPYKGWNMVWIPYCTGDAFGGSSPNTTLPGVSGPQQFVGYQNMQKFVGHIVPTFPMPERVVLTGTSAGSFGAGLSFNQVQDAYGKIPVTLILDSGVPFADNFMAPCLQKEWRDLWKIGAAIPPECTNCTGADGGGFINLVFFSAKKYPNVKLGVISANEDDVMRFFYGFGEMNCTAGGSYAMGKYTQAITDLRQQAAPYSSQFSSYYINGIKHMYSQFDDFYQPLSGGVTIAGWTSDLLAGTTKSIGP